MQTTSSDVGCTGDAGSFKAAKRAERQGRDRKARHGGQPLQW